MQFFNNAEFDATPILAGITYTLTVKQGREDIPANAKSVVMVLADDSGKAARVLMDASGSTYTVTRIFSTTESNNLMPNFGAGLRAFSSDVAEVMLIPFICFGINYTGQSNAVGWNQGKANIDREIFTEADNRIKYWSTNHPTYSASPRKIYALEGLRHRSYPLSGANNLGPYIPLAYRMLEEGYNEICGLLFARNAASITTYDQGSADYNALLDALEQFTNASPLNQVGLWVHQQGETDQGAGMTPAQWVTKLTEFKANITADLLARNGYDLSRTPFVTVGMHEDYRNSAGYDNVNDMEQGNADIVNNMAYAGYAPLGAGLSVTNNAATEGGGVDDTHIAALSYVEAVPSAIMGAYKQALLNVNPTPDVDAPSLSVASGNQTGVTTATGNVTTDEANGTLYTYVTQNAIETREDVLFNGTQQAVNTVGVQTVNLTGLTGSTSYYIHYVHKDLAGNDSDVISSNQFTTAAPPTVTFPYDPNRTISGSVKYVEKSGSDSADGSIGTPWLTINHALQNAVSGDTILVGNGTYNETFLDTNGLVADNVTLTSKPGDEPVVDMQGASWLRVDQSDNFTISHLKIINTSTAIQFNSVFSGATGGLCYSLDIERSVDGNNAGGIYVNGAGPNDGLVIDKVRISWTGAGDTQQANDGGIYLRRINGDDDARISLNRIEVRGHRSPILFKSGPDEITSSRGNFTITNSFFHYNGSGGIVWQNFGGIWFYNCIYAHYMVTPEENGFPSGDWNVFRKCTLPNGIQFRDGTQSGDLLPDSQDNKFVDCVIGSNFVLAGTNTSITQDSDYNLFYPSIINNKGSAETLAQWQTSNSSDANSVEGTPTYVGGNVEDISYYELDTGSVGENAASDGSDMGAIVSLIGVLADDGDTTAPTISSATSATVSDTAGSGTVTTNEGQGTLFTYVSTNAVETETTVVSNGKQQPVTASGVQNVSVIGLTASTTYYIHYIHKDFRGHTSNLVSSASFTTNATPDNTAPVLTSPTGTQTGQTTADGTVSTDEANGDLYFYYSTNASESEGTVLGGQSQAVSSTGQQNISLSGLTAGTTYYLHYVHQDAAGNNSNVASSTSFTTQASGPSTPNTDALAPSHHYDFVNDCTTGSGNDFASCLNRGSSPDITSVNTGNPQVGANGVEFDGNDGLDLPLDGLFTNSSGSSIVIKYKGISAGFLLSGFAVGVSLGATTIGEDTCLLQGFLGPNQLTASQDLGDDVEHVLALTIASGGQYDVWLDGVSVGSIAAGGINASTTAAALGCTTGGASGMTGYIKALVAKPGVKWTLSNINQIAAEMP